VKAKLYSPTSPADSIAIIDFGSQYSQLIARRVRETQVYCELFPYDAPENDILRINPKGFILSGGPSSIYEKESPKIPHFILKSNLPILGICYGMQALTLQLGGEVAAASKREYGSAEIRVRQSNPLLRKETNVVWMSHGDKIIHPPPGFEVLASSENSPYAAIGNPEKKQYGLQFHPEVRHTPAGSEILSAFVHEICGARRTWNAPSIVEVAIEQIQAQVGGDRAIAAVSGGIDSSVAAELVHRAIGDRLTSVFVDTGLLRSGEASSVTESFRGLLKSNFIALSAAETFLDALAGTTDPEAKRKIIGETFIRVFEEQARKLAPTRFLVQGTIYPDVIESSAPDRGSADRIKSHHNVGGLPTEMEFELIEPLRYLFKDEVRILGAELNLPPEILERHPFPGPGLAVRCLGEVSFPRLETLRAADQIVVQELKLAGLMHDETAQAFAVLLPVRSVGVMGDQRTYSEVVAIRAVTTEDFMTAEWARLPYDVLARMSSRIVNEVPGINRVVYDISTKPPATIEWE
jgi:GMP synthase (glutamine-hydrolysing)